MKDFGIVLGSTEQAKPVVVGKRTVYVHTEITPVTDDTGQPIAGLFQYRELQYGKDEYIQLLTEQFDAITADHDAINVDHELRLALLETRG